MRTGSGGEQAIWEGSPSQWVNLRTFLVSGIATVVIGAVLIGLALDAPQQLRGAQTPITVILVLLMAVALATAIRAYLTTRCTRYRVTNERVRITTGVFSTRTDDLEMYRVDDILLLRPLLLRLISRGNLLLMSSDRTNPQLLLEAIPDADKLRDEIRKCVEICRDRKKTRVLDFQ